MLRFLYKTKTKDLTKHYVYCKIIVKKKCSERYIHTYTYEIICHLIKTNININCFM